MLTAITGKTEEELYEQFLSRTTQELKELFAKHEPIRKWFIKACQETLNLAVCRNCKEMIHRCEHDLWVHTDRPNHYCGDVFCTCVDLIRAEPKMS